ncbi:MAG: DEAD/DEAH box helicase [Poseidonia sp.]
MGVGTLKLIPRYYQQEAVDAVWECIRHTDQNPLVVLPTGAGKSLVIAMIIRQALKWQGRAMVLAHRKELLQQNHEKIQALAEIDAGLYSAGLKRRDFTDDIICAGIQSVHARALEFGVRQLVIVDEAHLINDDSDSMYGRFLQTLSEVNPNVRCIGLTATPYRTGTGTIARPEGLFQDITYEAQTQELIEKGFLCPLTSSSTTSVDTGQIKVRGGEFVLQDMEKRFTETGVVEAAVLELLNKAAGRKSVLVFCCGVAHAKMVSELISRTAKEPVGVVTGETADGERKEILAAFRSGSLRWLVNVDVLTTGFDAPRVDCVAVLRATMSPGLFAQIVGRGLRISPEKQDCLVLDFGNNIERHGSLDDPYYGKAGGAGTGTAAGRKGATEEDEEDDLERVCKKCQWTVSSGDLNCPNCGALLPVQVRHEYKADTDAVIIGGTGRGVFEVSDFQYKKHHSRKKSADGNPRPATLRVDYFVHPEGGGGDLTETKISEWVCFDHTGFAKVKAASWWTRRSLLPVPGSVDEALELIDRGAIRHPGKLAAFREGAFWKLREVEFFDQCPKPESIRENCPAGHKVQDLPF